MRYLITVGLCLFLLLGWAQEDNWLQPNSWWYPQVPAGEVKDYSWTSRIYPGTIRQYAVYVPAQYDGETPAALMVFQDGHAYFKADGDFRVPIVFDNLIAQGKMPVTIGIFINPGHHAAKPKPENPWRVSNRSTEYDTLSNTYVNFLLEEIIPEVKKNYFISDDPKMRAICGISSGGICAFTAAWHRPDQFHKVLSHIGSFTDIKGGHNYPPLIRQGEKKDIKVFLQDGSNDLDNKFGNWFLANQQMAAALNFRGYDYKFVMDTGAHDGKHAGLILPEALEWLWSDQVPSKLSSQKYNTAKDEHSRLVFSEPTHHLSDLVCERITLKEEEELVIDATDGDVLMIIRQGLATVKHQERDFNLGENSVLFIEISDQAVLQALQGHLELLQFKMTVNAPMQESPSDTQAGSFAVDFDTLEYRPSKKGGRHDYFRRSTTRFPYFEMHVTTLNPGVTSHPPHTHKAEELIIMIEGETEERIGNKTYQGSNHDLYYLGSFVPHSIKNIREKPARYFAFQWY